MLRSMLNARALARAPAARFASTVADVAPATASASTPISAPTLRKLENRWEKLPEDEKDEIISALAERQKVDWKELTPLEKKAAWYISYGEWGPRRPVHAKGDGRRIFFGTLIGVTAALIAFSTVRALMPEQGKTMSREWQQASNDQLEEVNANPFTGLNQIQSPYKGVSPDDDDDDDDDE